LVSRTSMTIQLASGVTDQAGRGSCAAISAGSALPRASVPGADGA
jgi:hypothetical protein